VSNKQILAEVNCVKT